MQGQFSVKLPGKIQHQNGDQKVHYTVKIHYEGEKKTRRT